MLSSVQFSKKYKKHTITQSHDINEKGLHHNGTSVFYTVRVNQHQKTDDHTSVWTQVQVTGAILDAKTVAVFAPILRNRVVALSLGQLNSSAAGSRTISKGAPLPPPSVHLRQDNNVDLVVNRPDVKVKRGRRRSPPATLMWTVLFLSAHTPW